MRVAEQGNVATETKIVTAAEKNRRWSRNSVGRDRKNRRWPGKVCAESEKLSAEHVKIVAEPENRKCRHQSRKIRLRCWKSCRRAEKSWHESRKSVGRDILKFAWIYILCANFLIWEYSPVISGHSHINNSENLLRILYITPHFTKKTTKQDNCPQFNQLPSPIETETKKP